MSLSSFRQEIINHPSNKEFTKKGWRPIYTASKSAKIVIIGQAPGIKAQESEIPWNDKSGDNLIEWLGISSETFRDPGKISLLPMDFYYPGKAKTGDKPPRKDFAPMWHRKILGQMLDTRLSILIGKYAQDYYLHQSMKRNLTETVRSYNEYLPYFFPIVHPSPLNFRWQKNNPWFLNQVIPELKKAVKESLINE